jgi:hypothetical protein
MNQQIVHHLPPTGLANGWVKVVANMCPTRLTNAKVMGVQRFVQNRLDGKMGSEVSAAKVLGVHVFTENRLDGQVGKQANVTTVMDV